MNHPVALMTYNRPEHTRKVLDALTFLKPEPIYFFSDGPESSKDEKLVKKVRSQVSSITWTTPIEAFSDFHMGLRNSIISAADIVLGIHDTVIVLEDDCVPGPFFSRFMDECFTRYRDVEQVMSISGYSIPLSSETRDGLWDVYFFPRISSWGWGTWRHAWKHFRRDLSQATLEARQAGIDLTQGGSDVPALIEAQRKGIIDSWAVNWIVSVYLRGGVCAYPMGSHIRNIGFDGSGVHCTISDRFTVELSNHPPTCFPTHVVQDEVITKHFGGFYS